VDLQRSLKDLAELYGCEPSLAAIEQFRKTEGLTSISEKCFDAANIEFVLLDDGLTMDKMVSLGWHRKYIPGVHRVLRIETVAEAILNQAIISLFSISFQMWSFMIIIMFWNSLIMSKWACSPCHSKLVGVNYLKFS